MLIMASGNPNKPAAPITINHRRPSAQASASGSYHAHNHQNRFELGPPSLQDRAGFEAIAESSSSSVGMTCQACQQLGFRCVASDDGDGCTPCLDAGAECSLLALSPQSRKRKLHGDPFGESTVKRG